MFQSLLSWIAVLRPMPPCCRSRASGGFQSLLSWIAVLRTIATATATATPKEFQSLLSWIAVLRIERVHARQPDLYVSIPVVLDRRPPHRLRPRPGGLRHVSIPVVLDRRPPHLEGADRERLGEVSFNPCCLGSPSSARPASPAASQGVSGFNPCCLGSPSSARPQPRRIIEGADVSIPVVLDRRPPQVTACPHGRHLEVSIPVVLDRRPPLRLTASRPSPA